MQNLHKLLFAAVVALFACLAASEASESVQTESLATHTISGFLTIPSCNVCPSCSDCTASPAANVNVNTINKVVTKEVTAVKKTLLSKLKKAMRMINRLSRSNKRLRKREDALEAQNAKITSRIQTVVTKVKNVQAMPGPPGPRGPRGRDGRRGGSGARGLPGAPGAPGRAGQNGAQGPPGPPGRAGQNGAPGRAGPAGRPGSAGPAGPRGAQGPAGARGPQGPAGANGQRGPRGLTGVRGAKGPRGDKGNTGAAGRNGAPGRAGPPGPPGRNGRDGSNGRPGPQGPAGRNGQAGARGSDGRPGPQGPKGPQGPPGTAGKSVVLKPQSLRHPPEPVTKLATLTNGLSWEESEMICASNGLSLCSYKTLCYNGKPSENDFYTHQGLGWVPYGGDGNNAWLYLGNSPNAFCKTHPQLANGQRPGWGNVADRGGHHGALYCCGKKPIKKTPKLIGWSYDMSWQDTSNACEANGMHLCNYLSVCPNGPDHKPWDNKYWVTPVGYDDTWTPIGGEGNNMWIMLGKRHWPICYRHTEIQGGVHGRPGWGAVRDRGGHHGPILCCGGKDKIEETHLLAKKSSGMSWAETSVLCKKNEMHLCNFDSLCPNGWGKNPVVPRRGFDDWIPFDDNQGPGSYLQIGHPWPTCYRHSEVNGGPYGRPGWGNDRSTYPFKGEVFCCGKKPKPAQRLNIGSSAGSTWADANSKCMQRQKKLCTFNDICPNGPETIPIMGKKHGDTWIPIDDAGDNMWLQIGDAGWPACLRHTEIANGIHGRPGWGYQRGREGWHGPIYCC